MMAAKGTHKMCLLQTGKMRNTVKCIVPGTENRSFWGKKFVPLLEYMKNPHWDIPPLVKPKLEPPLACRKTSNGENTSLSQNSNQYHGKTQKVLLLLQRKNTNYSYFCERGKQKFFLFKLQCENFCTITNEHLLTYLPTYSMEQSPS